jgi:hypothetical protein
MITRKGLTRFALFFLVAAGVVIGSNHLVDISRRKASKKSEFAVIERIQLERMGQADKSALVQEFKEQRIRELHEHFHHLPDIEELDQEHQSQCLMCHSLLPHSKNERIRVMMNMHSDFLNCETCHYKKDPETIRYAWHDMGIDNELTRGPKFGTHYDEVTGMLEGTKNHISKITPIRRVDGREEVLFMSQRDPMAKDYLRVKDELTPGDREVAKKRFHGEIDSKGWACHECHRREGVLTLRELGFSERRVEELENLEIVGLFEKYEVFHLPKW